MLSICKPEIKDIAAQGEETMIQLNFITMPPAPVVNDLEIQSVYGFAGL